MLVLSVQLMYHRVPAVVPTIPISRESSKAALTIVPSRVISCSSRTELDLEERRTREGLAQLLEQPLCLLEMQFSSEPSHVFAAKWFSAELLYIEH